MCNVLVPARVVLSDPRRPLPPLPQHFTSALSSMAHVCAPPADTASTLRPVPRLTVASASPISPEPSPRSFCEPTPRRPSAPLPKHFTFVFVKRTQVCSSPDDRATAPKPTPRSIGSSASPISSGSSPRSSVSPVPKRPFPAEPQHFTCASSNSAHVCKSPADIATTLRPVPTLIVGVLATVAADLLPIAVIEPWPSWP